jgi:uncharacterized protein YbjT (DUF2867 family)
MSGYTNFAVIGAGGIGNHIVQQLLKDKAAAIVINVKKVVVLTRQVTSLGSVARDMLKFDKASKTTVEGGAKVIRVDYSNEGSIQHALTGVDVVISTIPGSAVDIQVKIAAACQKGWRQVVRSLGVRRNNRWRDGGGGAKADVQSQLKALDMPYAAFYTGLFADYAWVPCVSLVFTHFWLFRLVNHRLTGTSTSMSRAGKCPLVATATSRLRSPPERI